MRRSKFGRLLVAFLLITVFVFLSTKQKQTVTLYPGESHTLPGDVEVINHGLGRGGAVNFTPTGDQNVGEFSPPTDSGPTTHINVTWGNSFLQFPHSIGATKHNGVTIEMDGDTGAITLTYRN